VPNSTKTLIVLQITGWIPPTKTFDKTVKNRSATNGDGAKEKYQNDD
jgi:hypothetical protein